jgi:hypothetical protein
MFGRARQSGVIDTQATRQRPGARQALHRRLRGAQRRRSPPDLSVREDRFVPRLAWRCAADETEQVLRRPKDGEPVGDIRDEVGAVQAITGSQQVPLPTWSDPVTCDCLVLQDEFVQEGSRWGTEAKERRAGDARSSLFARPAPSSSTLI